MTKKAGELGLIFCSATSRFHYCTHFTNEETGTEQLLGILAKVTHLVIGRMRMDQRLCHFKGSVLILSNCF